jgi:hypothetical protein
MVENQCGRRVKTEDKQKKQEQQTTSVYEVSNDTSPQIKYLIINIINITLMTQLTLLRTTSQVSESIQQWMSPIN